MHNHKSSGVVGLGTLHPPCFVWASSGVSNTLEGTALC